MWAQYSRHLIVLYARCGQVLCDVEDLQHVRFNLNADDRLNTGGIKKVSRAHQYPLTCLDFFFSRGDVGCEPSYVSTLTSKAVN